MTRTHRQRRMIAVFAVLIGAAVMLWLHPDLQQPVVSQTTPQSASLSPVLGALDTLLVKGRAPKTNYSREQFGDGWDTKQGCDTRNIILHRDLEHAVVNDACEVMSGTLHDPYTGKTIAFTQGSSTSAAVQIDHVVALGDAWQTGAQQLSPATREALANDPLELLAVDGPTNQQKSDGDAATWLPPNKSFRCQYVARQVAVKQKYHLWVTLAEKEAIQRVLSTCPSQSLPV